MANQDGPGTALLTDRYELSMLQAALVDGTAALPAVFEVFARSLPAGRRYGVVAGTGRLAAAVAGFRFDADEVAWLLAAGVVDAPTAGWLAGYRFSGDVEGYAEGELYVGGSPVLTVVAPFAEALLLETVVLSILNADSAVAAAASRMTLAAGDRPCIEMGGRRAQEEAAVTAARAAYVAGFASTSNLAAGRRYGIPTAGTAAHSFTLAHRDEAAAFASQVAAFGPGTTLLVDTYDTPRGIEHAVAAAGPALGAIRLDSGDLAAAAGAARAQLDGLGAAGTKIVVSSDLDEFGIAALAAAPVDSYGVGTKVVTGSGSPTVGFVYKLVAIGDGPGGALRPVAKKAKGKVGVGGRKHASRVLDDAGHALVERVVIDDGRARPAEGRHLQVPLLRAGEPTAEALADVAAARAHHLRVRRELPPDGQRLGAGEPAWAVQVVDPDAGADTGPDSRPEPV